MRRGSRIPSLIAQGMLLLAAFGILDSASAYTEVCSGIVTVFIVKTEVQVPAGTDFGRFVNDLHAYANRRHYSWLPSGSGDEANKNGLIDVLLQNEKGNAIHVFNTAKSPAEIEAEMDECGSDEFMPYWNDFMKYLNDYMIAQPYYPSYLKPSPHH
jgi:hypothetical protein